MAYRDWAPYTFLDGFHADNETQGTTNERAFEVQDGGSTTIQVLLPEGCVGTACAMQAKSKLLLPEDSATLKFKCVLLTVFTAQGDLKRTKENDPTDF